MFVFEMFEPFLIVIIWLHSASVCVFVCVSFFVHILVCISAGSYFFSCNESRWGESVSIPPAPPLLLSLWFL